MTQARPHPTPAARAALFLGVLILAFLPGCAIRFGGSVTQDKALLALRDENQALKEQLADKDRRISELELKAQAEFASRFGAASEAQAGGGIAHAAASLPTLTTLSLDSLSGVWIADGAAEALFYIKTLDGRNRFTQATGTLVAEVLTAPSGPGEAHVFLANVCTPAPAVAGSKLPPLTPVPL